MRNWLALALAATLGACASDGASRVPPPPDSPRDAPDTTAGGLVTRLRADLARRGANFDRQGTREPAGGLSPDGDCADGRPAERINLEVPPEGAADMYTVVAFVCASSGRYWVVREGGIAGAVKWVGPFDLPRGSSR